ncbi:hypothetical protein H310_11118 [Aphanomyces invadans]|uniref:Uncharacterized protein n=1 Tax=Aphanomyces invadans TaxID=157072 RepID=A0A024TQR2_9STRA|nr:hypothetical protein H310_11118 [Aphanomyces invadans]ETV95702.1 hypothetical protein H310_11118 [Aphanomyces invadans]|eukprot:XP_008875895.1 hypothetical protein H310_11118 [Aphanomyces invadans]
MVTNKKKSKAFSLVQQPPIAPDTNILDLDYFAAIQPLQQKMSVRSIVELVANVVLAFDDLVETMRLFGDNAYKLPHMGKEKLAHKGQLPQNMQYPLDVYLACKKKLAAQDAVAMERAVSAEVEEARCHDELDRQHEYIAQSDSDATDDIISAMAEVGIEPIRINMDS